MSAVWVVASHTLRECTRRRVFVVVPVVTVAFLVLYSLGAYYAFRTSRSMNVAGGLVDARALTGATLIGLSMFVTLFLGSALGIFLTFSAVRGDSEQGVLQAVVVRPIARSGLLVGKFVGASAICLLYVLFLYAASVLTIGAWGRWWPEPMFLPGLQLALAAVVVIALTLLGSVFMSALANGIAMFMVYGAGLLAGLMGQLGEVLNSSTLRSTGTLVSWLLPFEALYQAGLYSLTAQTTGVTRVLVRLGPLGGARPGGVGLVAWTLVYLGFVAVLALTAFSRRDL